LSEVELRAPTAVAFSLPGVELTVSGLRITDPNLPIEDFTNVCYVLGTLHEAVRFALGDAILAAEELYGQEGYQPIEAMNLSEEARREYVRVAQRVPKSRRRKHLSWSHHRAVAALEPAAQKDWLRRCETEGLSHHALRDELRNGQPAKQTTICRCCGRDLD
jgi:hypothetical protein